MTLEEENKKKKKPPRKLKNELRKYADDPPYIYACHKAWRPVVYEFRPEILFYDVNAYDKFIPAMEMRSPDEHSLFTKFLQSFDTNISSVFYKWITDNSDRTYSGTHNLGLGCAEEELPCAQAQWWKELRPERAVWPLRRAYSASQIDLNAAEIRFQQLPKINPKVSTNWIQTMYPYNVKQRCIVKAQDFIWKRKGAYRFNLTKCSVGFVKVKLVEGAIYGPKKFFVYFTAEGEARGEPGKYFTHHLIKKINNEKLTLEQIPPGYIGPAIYYMKEAASGLQYFPVYILDHKVNNSKDILLFHLEIGTIIRCRHNEIVSRLRILPFQMYQYAVPKAIPCRMHEDQMTGISWDNFVSEVQRTGEMYVTSVFPRYLQVGRVKPKPKKNLERFFCDDVHCLGGCVKDEQDLSDLIYFDIYRKTRKVSISSADISDVEL